MAKEKTGILAVEGESLADIPLGLIVPTKHNARVIDEKSPAFLDLKNSIAGGTTAPPVHVRPHPEKEGAFELLAGARRLRVHQVLKLPTIRAVVHAGMSDKKAIMMTYKENACREDLKAIEKGAMFANLLWQFGGDKKAVAKEIGCGETHLAQCLSIHTDLAPEWRKAATNPESPVASWSARALALIARLPEHSQLLLLKVLAQRHDLEHIRLEDIERAVAEAVRPMGKQPWSVDDAGLYVKAGACSRCIKRSAVQPDLWDDDKVRGKPRAFDRCLDPVCWHEKGLLFIERRIAELRKAGEEFILVEDDDSYATGAEDREAVAPFGQFLANDQYRTVKPNVAGAEKALIILGPGAGRETWIKRYALERRPSEPREKLTLAQKREQLKSRRWAETINRISADVRKRDVTALVDAKGKPLSPEDRAALVMTLAAKFGLEPRGYVPRDLGEVRAALAEKGAFQSATSALWKRLREVLARDTRYFGSTLSVPNYILAGARGLAALFAFDVDAMFETVSAEKGFTEPKSWTAEAKAAKKGKGKGPRGQCSCSPDKIGAAAKKKFAAPDATGASAARTRKAAGALIDDGDEED